MSHRFYCTTVFLQRPTVWEGEVECPQLVCKIQYLEIFTNGHSFFQLGYIIVIPCMQRLHQFYQLKPKGES